MHSFCHRGSKVCLPVLIFSKVSLNQTAVDFSSWFCSAAHYKLTEEEEKQRWFTETESSQTPLTARLFGFI